MVSEEVEEKGQIKREPTLKKEEEKVKEEEGEEIWCKRARTDSKSWRWQKRKRARKPCGIQRIVRC